MGTVTVALVREQGVEFGVFLVKGRVLRSPTEREEALVAMVEEFGRPFALMSESGETWGDANIVRFLESVSPDQLPWQEFQLN
jgi:hypothetical protein